jgi:flagellar export protein FliJ
MAKFKYKYEPIRKVKEQLQKKVQKEISIIDLEIGKLKSEISELLEKLKIEREKAIGKNSIKVSELHFYSKYETYTNQNIKRLNKLINELKIKRLKMVKELMQKSKEAKIFETLKEKHQEDFKKVQDKIEQLQMDEIAVNNFNKGNE